MSKYRFPKTDGMELQLFKGYFVGLVAFYTLNNRNDTCFSSSLEMHLTEELFVPIAFVSSGFALESPYTFFLEK